VIKRSKNIFLSYFILLFAIMMIIFLFSLTSTYKEKYRFPEKLNDYSLYKKNFLTFSNLKILELDISSRSLKFMLMLYYSDLKDLVDNFNFLKEMALNNSIFKSTKYIIDTNISIEIFFVQPSGGTAKLLIESFCIYRNYGIRIIHATNSLNLNDIRFLVSKIVEINKIIIEAIDDGKIRIYD